MINNVQKMDYIDNQGKFDVVPSNDFHSKSISLNQGKKYTRRF